MQARDKQCSFCLLIPRDESHKDPDEIDLNVPRHAQYLHNAWKRHQDAVYWVDIDLAIQKGLKFYQTRLKTGAVLYEKVCVSPRPPPKISLKHEWTRELGSKVARQPDGEVARQAKFFQQTHDMQDGRNTSRSQEINVNSFNDELSSSDRTGRLVETEVSQTRSSEDSKSLNVEQTHDRTGRPVATLHTAEAQDSSQSVLFMTAIRSTLMMMYFVKEWKNPLLFMTRIMNR